MIEVNDETDGEGYAARVRYPLLATAFLCLGLGIWGGLTRLGVAEGGPMLAHGPLMISGFLGTLIGLERAVGLQRPWVLAAPTLSAAGALVMIAGGPFWDLLFLAASAMLLGATLSILRLQPELHSQVMAAGAACWLVGNLLMLEGRPAALWWCGFPLLTIVGERLLLSRLRAPSGRAVSVFGGLVVLYFFSSAAAVGLALWLIRYDVALKTIRLPGLPRFAAVCVLSGYFWLVVHGVLSVTGGSYDAVVHSLLLGFMMPMIFAHAPIVLPAVTGLAIPFTRAAYLPLALLHVSVAVRVLGWVAPGAVLGAAAIGLFVLVTLKARLACAFD